MKKLVLIMITVLAVLASCNDYETYGDMKKKERDAINKFIADSSITVISEDVFVQNNYKTDLNRNEFVKLDKSGVYMQIVRQGCGTKLQDGETANLVCRYREYNILEDVVTSLNNTSYTAAIPDIMRVSRNSGTYSATFTKSASITVNGNTIGNMYYTYQSAQVPSGWLVPLSYINVGAWEQEGDEISEVHLIVPHSQGHTTASGNVTPYFYVITYHREV